MKIYLATPYTHDNPEIREIRFLNINEVAAKLMKDGHIVYSPISSSHQIAKDHNLPTTYDYWEKVCDAFVLWCDQVWVYTAPGWEESVGVQAEIELAKRYMKGIKYIDADYNVQTSVIAIKPDETKVQNYW